MIKSDSLYVIDGAIPIHFNYLLQNRALDSKYVIHKGSRFEKENDHYMACYLNDADLVSTGILPHITDVLNELKTEQYLIRSYINMYSHFTPTTAHVDENVVGNMTCLYWFNTRWERNWGGEITFYDVDGRNYTIEYIPGRLLVFDGTILHRVNPLTAFAKDFRFCLTLKCADKRTKDFVYNKPDALQLSTGITND
jgi:Rps23 Pro-64 3,4-dihydroxylase Tpa1-like proline 4-hydroxylase